MIETLLLVDVIGLPTPIAFLLGALTVGFCTLAVAASVWFVAGARKAESHEYDRKTYPRFDEN